MISIIIIVKNDIRIKKTLEKLRLLPGINKREIIVVDASCGSLEKIRLKFPEVKWINFKGISDKKATYSEQRNLGIKKSKGSIIVFIDSDCIPEDQWLNNLTGPILEGKEIITSGAVLSLPKGYMIADRQAGPYMKYGFTANMALNKNVFKEVGLFDESFERCEDTDISIRIINDGYKIRYVKDAIVYHDSGNFRNNINRNYYNGVGMAKIYKRYKSELCPTKIVKNLRTIYSIVYVLYIILLPITIIFPYYPLLIFLPSIIFWRNPLKELLNIIQAWGLIVGLFTPSNK
jgi:GT2 family glycosyltransferase